MGKLIHFKSLIFQNKQEVNKIAFTAKMKETNWNNFRVFEFVEPSNNVMNRIEISEKNVNIFAGPSSINLAVNQTLGVQYETPGEVVILKSFMKFLNHTENAFDFRYTLYNGQTEIGEYHIFLTIRNET